jgi:hypothetical protein
MPDPANLESKSTERVIAIEMAPATAEVVHSAPLNQGCAPDGIFRKSMVSICFSSSNNMVTTVGTSMLICERDFSIILERYGFCRKRYIKSTIDLLYSAQ